MNEEMLREAHRLGEHYTMEVRRELRQGKIEVKFVPKDSWGEGQLPSLTEAFSNQLCSLFYTYFGIGGKIVEIE